MAAANTTTTANGSTDQPTSTKADDATLAPRLGKGGRHALINCDYCRRDITSIIHVKCAECTDFELCLECFANGIEVEPHIKTHSYRVMSQVTTPLFEPEWGADEELTLLDGIEQYGLGNWNDIAELIGNNKTKQRCEAHYTECYLQSVTAPLPDVDHCLCDGFPYQRGGAIQQSSAVTAVDTTAPSATTAASSPSPSPVPPTEASADTELNANNLPATSQKTPTPQALQQAGFVPAETAAPSTQTKRRQSKYQQKKATAATPGALPNSASESALVGAQTVKPKVRGKGLLVGWQEKRGDFDTEYENNAELMLADMEFKQDEPPSDTELKLQVLNVYNQILDMRAERKKFILERGLLERREKKRSKEEREVYAAMRPFARFHSAAEHEALVQGIVNENRLRQRIQQLQHYRLMGIRTLAEADLYESEKRKRDTALAMKKQSRGADPYSAAVADSRLSAAGKPTSSRRGQTIVEEKEPVTDSKRPAKRPGDTDTEMKEGDDSKAVIKAKVEDTWDCSHMPDVDKLSDKERQLCNSLHLEPRHYLQVREKLLSECINRGLYKHGTGHQLVRIDINAQEKVLDFFVSVGWLSTADAFGVSPSLRGPSSITTLPAAPQSPPAQRSPTPATNATSTSSSASAAKSAIAQT